MMMIATCGSNIKPLEHIIQKTDPEQILLLTYQSTETEFLEKQVVSIVPTCEVFIEIIRIPENPDEEWWYYLHNEIQEMILKPLDASNFFLLNSDLRRGGVRTIK